MKARVISTRRVVDVVKTTRTKIIHDYFGGQNNIEIVEYYDGKKYYTQSELEFDVSSDPDYWTRLEHQYAGMAMHGMLSNPDLLEVVTEKKGLTKKEYADKVACVADIYATALVEKMKEERK